MRNRNISTSAFHIVTNEYFIDIYGLISHVDYLMCYQHLLVIKRRPTHSKYLIVTEVQMLRKILLISKNCCCTVTFQQSLLLLYTFFFLHGMHSTHLVKTEIAMLMSVYTFLYFILPAVLSLLYVRFHFIRSLYVLRMYRQEKSFLNTI